ncbi:MAG TPA: peptidase T [Cyanobacteria bacterium UBA8530]|nr:peptidase T [Cyanobacteria bacterium UBA8530]
MNPEHQKALLERFLRYTAIDTQSENDVDRYPSTEKQKVLGEILVQELKDLGLSDASMDSYGYVTATLKGNVPSVPAIGFIAHLDTAPDVSGENVKAIVHENYRGGEIRFSGAPELGLSPEDCSALADCVGEDIITSDGTTLLGGDDKAGIAAIMTAVEMLGELDLPRGDIRIAFTPDEEVGRGTEFFDTERFGVRYAYTVDGGMKGELSAETFNANTAIVTIGGINIHPGKAKDVMVNAIQVLGDFLKKLPRELTPQETEDREGFIHPVSVEGGVDKVVVKMILRDFDLEGLTKQKAILEEAIAATKVLYPRAKLDLEIKESYRNMRLHLEKDPRVVQFALDAMEEAGLTPVSLPIRGGTDGAELSRKGVLTPNLFYGGSNFHSFTEWVSLQQMCQASEVLVRLARIWAERGKK